MGPLFFPPLYGAADEPHFEGWQILAAMAVTTSNVSQIGMLVTGCGYRNADLLADMARTLDHLSDGRAVLGIGSGWMDKDESEYGYPVRTPAQRLDALAEALPRIRGGGSGIRMANMTWVTRHQEFTKRLRVACLSKRVRE